jgi:hypothetical protein
MTTSIFVLQIRGKNGAALTDALFPFSTHEAAAAAAAQWARTWWEPCGLRKLMGEPTGMSDSMVTEAYFANNSDHEVYRIEECDLDDTSGC